MAEVGDENGFYIDDDERLWRNRLGERAAAQAENYAPLYGAPTGKAAGTGQAARYNHGKVELSYVPYEQMYATARGMMYGASKYARNNFRHGFVMESVCDSLLRHVFALLKGELIDPESGLSHVDLINCNAAFLAVGTEAGWEWKSHTKGEVDGSK